MSQRIHGTVAHPSSIHLSRFLSSNEVPGALEAASIHRGINNIQNEISRLQSQLDLLERLLQKHRRVISAIRRTSTEVWGRIFTFVLPVCMKGSERRELLHLALICKTWYQAVRVTHGLWSQYLLDTHPPSYEAAKSWLGRSGKLPKSLEVVCSHRREDADDRCTVTHSEVVKVLAEGFDLNHLSLRCQVPLCVRKLCERIHPSQWGLIRSLALHFKSEVFEDDETSNSFDIPPSVMSLTIDLSYEWHRYRPTQTLRISPSVYARLTSFSFNSAAWESGADFLAALQDFTSLENLTISFVHGWWLYEVDSTVSVPYLRTLHLLQVQETTILKNLMMPALTELVVRGEHLDREPEDFQWFFPNPELRCPNLRVFRLYTPMSVHPYRLASTLRHLSHLTELTLSGAVSDSHADSSGVDYGYDANECSCHNGEKEGAGDWTPSMWVPPTCDAFQILHSWDRECGASQNLPSLQVLEILDLPTNYDFTYICDYLQQRLEKRPGHASDTLKTFTASFLPYQVPRNSNFRNFKTVHEELEKVGIRASITPSELKPSKLSSYEQWDYELYPFDLKMHVVHPL